MPDWFYTMYLLVSVGATCFCLSMVVYAWSRRTVEGATMFAWSMLATAGWTACIVMSMMSPNEAAAKMWESQIRYAFVAVFPVLFLGFTLEYAERGDWFTPRAIALLLVIPAILQAVNWIQPTAFHEHVAYEKYNGFWIVSEYTPALGFGVHAIYTYLLIFYGIGVLISRLYNAPALYKAQVAALLGGVSVPIIVNIAILSGLVTVSLVDWTSISFTVTGLIWTWALFRYRLFDLTPVAYESIVRTMDDAVIVIDTQNRLVDMNPAAERLANVLAQELVGQPVQMLFSRQQALLDQYLHAEKAQSEITIGNPPRFFDLQITTLYRRQQPTGRLLQLRDITARKQIELEREGLIADLRAYAHSVAHNLKNPIGVINGAAELMLVRDGDDLNESQIKYLTMISNNSKKITSIINELLLLASVRELNTIPFTPLDMPTILQSAQARLTPQIEKHQAKMEITTDWPSGVGYAPWVEEIWVNYLSNAMKYGGTPPMIHVGAEQQHQMVRFYVRDNGSGLNPDEIKQLFTAFTRLRPPDGEGHGLGLSIVHRIVERLGGQVGVESTLGQGSTFYFTLPLAG